MKPMESSTTTRNKPPGEPKNDFLSSIVVFLIALPLCMGISIASGVPVAAGLVTGIIGGLVVGTLSGAPLQVSGPAAGLTVLVYQVVQTHGLEMFGVVVLIAGAVQFTAGLLKLGQWFRAVSPAVIKGMLAGIGILIFASQFHVMVDDKPAGSGLTNLATIPQAVAKGLEIPEVGSRESRIFRTQHLREFGRLHADQIQVQEAVAEVVAKGAAHGPDEAARLKPLIEQQAQITAQLADLVDDLEQNRLPTYSEKEFSRLNAAATAALAQSRAALSDLKEGRPEHARESQMEAAGALDDLLGHLKNHHWAALIGILTIGTILAWQAFAPRRLKLLPAPLVAIVLATLAAAAVALPVIYVEVPDRLLEDLHTPSWVNLQEANWVALLQAGLLIAAIASAETLLCATAVDQMHQGPRTKYDRELAAQGFGNMLCGCLGALPMTGVIVRSSVNVQAGAKGRTSAILHGVWLLVFVLLLSWVLRMIPTASLAAMLVYTGYKLVNPASIRELWKFGWGEVAVYAVTVVMIVSTDLLTGVLAGLGMAALKLLTTVSRLKTTLDVKPDGGPAVLTLEGAATFIRLPMLAAELERIPRDIDLRIEFRRLSYIDHACLELLKNWQQQHEAAGATVHIDWESLHARFQTVHASGEPPAGPGPRTREFVAPTAAAGPRGSN